MTNEIREIRGEIRSRTGLTAVLFEGEARAEPKIQGAADRSGFRLVSVADPQAAIRRALEPDVGLVLIDFARPGLSGVELQALIRSHELSLGMESVAVVALSQRATPEERARLFSVGFAGQISSESAQGEIEAALSLVRTSMFARDRGDSDYLPPESSQSGNVLMPRLFESLDTQARIGMTIGLENLFTDMLFRILLVRYGAISGDIEELCRDLAVLSFWTGFPELLRRANQVRRDASSSQAEFEMSIAHTRIELDRAMAALRRRIHWAPTNRLDES